MRGPQNARHRTGTGTEVSSPGVLYEAHLGAGTATSTATVYDNTSATGKILCRLAAPADGPGDSFRPPGGVSFTKGLHVVLAGAGATVDLAIVASGA
jgi:hypothetical protein